MSYKCKFCTRVFSSKSSRNNHHQIAHKNKDELNYKCKECKIFFETKEDLRVHSFIHFYGEIKHCHICDQIFKSSKLLNIHLQKHSNTKINCETCSQTFTFESGLRKHIRLNRCKGPSLIDKDVEVQTDELEVIEIAKRQLDEISSNFKKVKKKMISKKSNVQFDRVVSIEEDFSTNESIEEQEKDQKPKRKSQESENLQLKKSRRHMTYLCDLCGIKIKFRKNIENHMKENHLKKIYKCNHCSESFKSRNNLYHHSQQIHGIKTQVVFEKFSCDVCDRKFDMKSMLKQHKLSHEDIRPQVCDICNASFKSVGNMRRHLSCHNETKNYLCDLCSKSFKSKMSLKVHKETVHADMKVYVNCRYCKAIVQERNLKIHEYQQHTDKGKEKPFSCAECGSCFRKEYELQRHINGVHETTSHGTTYKCQECDETFNRLRDLRDHSYVHFVGPVHMCLSCGAKFKNRRLLLIHAAVHNPNKSFPCNICNAIFQTIGGRRKHITKIHNNVTTVCEISEHN